MKKLLLALMAVIVLAGTASAATLTFDEFTSITNYANLPDYSYGGYTWTGDWEVTSINYYQSTYSNTFDFPSNSYAAYNGYDTAGYTLPVTISSSTPFRLQSAYFSAWTRYDDTAFYSATSLTINAYLGGSLVDSLVIDLAAGALQLYTIDMVGDTFEFVQTGSGDNQWWVMDNVSVNPTPIPGAIWLLGSGLVGLAGLRKKFRA